MPANQACNSVAHRDLLNYIHVLPDSAVMAELRRELVMRQAVYPKLIARGSLSRSAYIHRMACLMLAWHFMRNRSAAHGQEHTIESIPDFSPQQQASLWE